MNISYYVQVLIQNIDEILSLASTVTPKTAHNDVEEAGLFAGITQY